MTERLRRRGRDGCWLRGGWRGGLSPALVRATFFSSVVPRQVRWGLRDRASPRGTDPSARAPAMAVLVATTRHALPPPMVALPLASTREGPSRPHRFLLAGGVAGR